MTSTKKKKKKSDDVWVSEHMGSSQNGARHAVSLTHSPPGAQAGPEPISVPSRVPSARQTRAARGSCARGMRLAPTERGWLSKTFYEQKKKHVKYLTKNALC